MPTTTETRARLNDALDHARTSAQELLGALSDAAARQGGAIMADLEALPPRAKAIADAIAHSFDQQSMATQHAVGEARTALEATATQAGLAFKSSGQAAEIAMQQAIAEARASVQKLGDAIAAGHASKP